MHGTYIQNKKSVQNWNHKNKEKRSLISLRYYYKMKIKNVIWREIMYEFLDILRPD